MQGERCLSDFWREDKSDDRVMELASVLMGADSLIGVMGSGVRAVWSTNGQSETWWVRTKQGKPCESRVFLDYSPLASLKPPFGGQLVDEVIGYAAHEGGHCLWSDENGKTAVEAILRARPLPASRRAAADPKKVEEVLRIDNILEDVFIDYHVGEEWPVLGEYIRWSRYKIAERRPIDYDLIARDARPARNSIINLWIGCSLYDKPLPDKMSARVRRAMTFLMSKSLEAVKAQSPSLRLGLAVECWEYLTKEFPVVEEPLPRQAPSPKPQPQPAEPQESQEKAEGQGEGEGSEGEGEAKGEGEEESEEGGGGADAGKDNVPKEAEPEGSSEERDAGEDNVPEEAEAEGEGKGEGEGAEAGEAGGAEGEGEGEGDMRGEGEEDKEGEAGEDEGEAKPEAEAEGGEAEAEPEEVGQELGHIGGEKPEGQESGESQEGGQQGGDEQGAPGNLDDFDIRDLGEVPKELLEEVMDAIAHEIEDLSRSVAEVINRPVGSVMAQTKKADYDGPAADRVRAQVEPQIQEMRRVFDRQAQVKSRHLKGLTTGKLDGRSLARVGTGNLRVYKRREVLDTPDLAVGLLLDVSGSMGSYMPTVWATGAVFAEALIRKQGVNFLALTYTGGSFNVQTTRICDRNMGRLCIGNVDQGGGTPSGPAIASIKTLMDRMRERQKVIIHFTDGQPDDQWSVKSAVQAARKAGYAVWAIAPQGYEKMLEDQYGQGNWETISAIRDLPAKVAELVERLVASR